MEIAIDQDSQIAEDLRWRAENDPTGDGEPVASEAEMLKRWLNDPRARLAATLWRRANEGADEAARQARGGVVSAVDEQGRHWWAVIERSVIGS